MFGLPKSYSGAGPKGTSSLRRKSDGETASAEVAVLKALHIAARCSSPHKAAVRAGIARAISVIEAATLGLCHTKELIDEAEALCQSALDTEDMNKRALLAERYGELIGELNAIATATGHGGVHLINDSDSTCEVALGTEDNITMKLPHINLTPGAKGLALPKASRAFGSTHNLEQLKGHMTLVKDRLDQSASIFREHGADLAKRLALVLEYAIPDEHELRSMPHLPAIR